MGFWDWTDFIDSAVGVNQLKEAKELFRFCIIISIVGTIVVAAICVGIMYLRFRVWG